MLDGWTIAGSYGSRLDPAGLDLGADVTVGEQHGRRLPVRGGYRVASWSC